MKRKISILILAATLASLASCGGEPSTSPNVTEPSDAGTTSAEVKPTDGLPDKKMDGYEFVIYMPDHNKLTWALTWVDVTETSGDIVYDEMYERNRRIEERFDCKISESPQENNTDALRNSVLAGDNIYKIAQINDVWSLTPSTVEVLTTWDKLPYVNLDAEWWNQSANEAFTVLGKQYAAIGDFNLSEYSKAYMLYFNKDIYNEIKHEKTVYEMVMDGTWTIDALISTAKEYASDLNGDTKMDDKNDRFGYSACPKVGMSLLVTGAGIKFVETDKSGTPVFAIPGNELYLDKMQKIIDKFKGSENWYYNAPDAYGAMQDVNFTDGRSLFQAASIWQTDTYRALEFDLGMLPAPKFDENQEDYHSVVAGGVVTGIPKSLSEEEFENVSIILEALAFDLRQNLLPIYKETVLQGRYARDDESMKIIDIIFDSATYDMGVLAWERARRAYMTGELTTFADTLVSTTETLKAGMAEDIQKTLDVIS